jgi:DNA-binding MarR family transcriptional regulator
MTLQQFKTLIELTRIKPNSIAAQGAALVMVNGLTQTKAAEILGCNQTTISHSVRTLRDKQRIARQVA